MRNSDCKAFVGLLELDLTINSKVSSLKDKRRVIRSLKDKLRNSYNISISEVGSLEDYYRSGIGISIISNEKKNIDRVLNSIVDSLDRDFNINIEDFRTRIL